MSSITNKIQQDIDLLEICLRNKEYLITTKTRIYKTEFWNHVQMEYNSKHQNKLKTIKQLRERFKYLYRSFQENHCLTIKYNKNLHRNDFIQENKDLVEKFKQISFDCFHAIKYNKNTQLVIEENECMQCLKEMQNQKSDESILTYQKVYEMEYAKYNLKPNDKFNHTFTHENRIKNIFQEIEDYISSNPVNVFNVKNGVVVDNKDLGVGCSNKSTPSE